MSESAYPKMLYLGGVAYDPETGKAVPHQNTLVVNDAAEEAAAEAEGYAAAVLPEAAEEPEALGEAGEPEAGGDETLTPPEGDETLSGAEGADSLDGGQAADALEPEAAAEVEPAAEFGAETQH